MVGVTRLPQFGEKLLMLSSVCHHGRGSGGIIMVRSWALKPLGLHGKKSIEVHRRLFRKLHLSAPAGFGSHHAFVNNLVTHIREAPIYKSSEIRGLSPKVNFSVTSFSPDNPEETPPEDLSTFRPPPPAAPIRPEQLLSEVPFQYWYSYADLPDNSFRKKKTKQSNAEEPRRSLQREMMESSDPSSAKIEQPRRSLMRALRITSSSAGLDSEKPRKSPMRELRDTSGSCGPKPEERRRSLMREKMDTSGPDCLKQEEPRRSLMRESREFAGSRAKSREPRRSLMREPRENSGFTGSRRGNAAPSITSTCQSNAETARERLSHAIEVQDRTGIAEKDDCVEREPAEFFAGKDSSGNFEQEPERTTSSGTTEGTGMEKEGFRLSKKEINLLIDKCNRSSRQINMGWRGWGHNYITLVHSYWKKSEVCKIKCKGAVTLDMDFLCNKLEEKTGGRVIHRNLGVVYLYRGRDYDPKFAPKLPVMRQRKKSPAKRLPIPFGLTKDDVNALRARGKELPALCKLAKNGVYVTLLNDIRKAFERSDLVRVNCQGFEARNFRALGVKLKKLVPCVLISYEFEHILMWRWDGFRAPSPEEAARIAEESFKDEEEDAQD